MYKTAKNSSHTPEIPARASLILAIVSLLGIFLWLGLSQFSLPQIFGISAGDVPLILITFGAGSILAWQILGKLWQRDFGADLIAAIALVTAAWLGNYLAATLIVLMLASGEALETYAKRRASSVLGELASRMPNTAHRKIGERIETIAITDIQIGDAIVVFPHETAPVDGIVIEGHSTMDESYLTGEPYHISKAPGSNVLSGAINGEAVLILKAEKKPEDSRYAKILDVMRAAEEKRPNLRRLGDKIGAIFAPIALITAAVSWGITGDSQRFLAVLVVATPCPLLIAIPITIVSAISMAAKRGILIKDPTVLERLPTCRTAIFDKTGTLTYGQPELTDILVAQGHKTDDILQAAASLERYSKHPLAGAVLAAAEKAQLFLPEAEQVSEKPGQGLSGLVAGKHVVITHRKKLATLSPQIVSALPDEAAGLECIVLQNDQYAATLRFRDTPRTDGKPFIEHLSPSHQFRKVMLLSGDRESEVNYLAKELGIEHALSSQTPEQKLAIVRAETALAPTLFMGDGINDAPALTAATVGLAFGQNTNVTGEAAGAVLMDSTLIKVDELLHLSLATRRIALQSAVSGMLASLIGMGLAAFGSLSPVQGALLQEVIDVFAILNALRLIWGKRPTTDL